MTAENLHSVELSYISSDMAFSYLQDDENDNNDIAIIIDKRSQPAISSEIVVKQISFSFTIAFTLLNHTENNDKINAENQIFVKSK